MFDFLKNENKIAHFGIDFTIYAPDKRVEYELFYSLGDMKGYNLLKDFKDYALRLGKDAFFTPHISLFRMFNSRYFFNLADCLSADNEYYCMPVSDVSFNATGRELVEEGVR